VSRPMTSCIAFTRSPDALSSAPCPVHLSDRIVPPGYAAGARARAPADPIANLRGA
jgi:hypothetical protein